MSMQAGPSGYTALLFFRNVQCFHPRNNQHIHGKHFQCLFVAQLKTGKPNPWDSWGAVMCCEGDPVEALGKTLLPQSSGSDAEETFSLWKSLSFVKID